MSRAQPRFRRVNPPLPPVGNSQGVVRYRIQGQIEGQMTMTTFAFLGPNNNPTGPQLTTLLTNLQATIFPLYGSCISIDWGGNNIEFLDVVHRGDIAGTFSTANGGAFGTRSAGHLPTEVAIQVSRYTNFKGQHGRGRYSLPGVPKADVTASTITAGTLLTAITALNNGLQGNFSDGANIWNHCIAQRTPVSPKLVTNAAAVSHLVTRVLLGTIRRRKIGRGK